MTLPPDVLKMKQFDFFYCCRIILNTRAIAEGFLQEFREEVEDELNQMFAYFHPSCMYDMEERKFTKIGLSQSHQRDKDMIAV